MNLPRCIVLCAALLSNCLLPSPIRADALDHWATNRVPFTNFARGSNTYCAIAGITYGSGVFVGAGRYDCPGCTFAYTSAIVTSSNGVDWADQGYVEEGLADRVVYAGGKFFILTGEGLSHPILVSTNGYNWTVPTTPFNPAFGPSFSCHDLAYGNGLYVAVGMPWGATSSLRTNILYSFDGNSWIQFFPSIWKQTSIEQPDTWAIAFGNGVFVAFAYTNPLVRFTHTGESEVRFSAMTNGAWRSMSYAPNGQAQPWPHFSDIAFGNGIFVLVGTNIVVITNQNLFTNSVISSAPVDPPTTNRIYRISFDGGIFVATAFNEILTSVDGVSWENRGTFIPVGDVSFGRGRFIAAAGTNFLVSEPFTDAAAGQPAGTLKLSGAVGYTHQIQASETLTTNSWQVLTNITLTNTSRTWFDAQATNTPQRFYRTQLLP